MKSYSEFELNILNIQIGCVIRLARLKKGLSQHQLSLILDSNSTNIGRIERFENASSWDKLYVLCQNLDLDFCELFILKNKEDLLLIVDESHSLEVKLTRSKQNYYKYLKALIQEKFS